MLLSQVGRHTHTHTHTLRLAGTYALLHTHTHTVDLLFHLAVDISIWNRVCLFRRATSDFAARFSLFLLSFFFFFFSLRLLPPPPPPPIGGGGGTALYIIRHLSDGGHFAYAQKSLPTLQKTKKKKKYKKNSEEGRKEEGKV